MSELEYLRDKVEQLEAALGMKVSLAGSLGLSPLKERMVGLLVRREIVSREMMLDAIYAGRNEPDPKTIDVHLMKIKKTLAGHGIEVKNRYGVGWYIQANDKLKLANLMETKGASEAA